MFLKFIILFSLLVNSQQNRDADPKKMSGSKLFLFPETSSNVIPDPKPFFSDNLLSNPLPTNSFFQNFLLKKGDQPEYIHPYLIKSNSSSLTICYPSLLSNSNLTLQTFTDDLVISSVNFIDQGKTHIVSAFSDLSLTLDTPGLGFRFFLARGSPFVTFQVEQLTRISISSAHTILQLYSKKGSKKHTIKLNNGQTWLVYSSRPIHIYYSAYEIATGLFSGVIRIAILTNSSSDNQRVLSTYSKCYPISGSAPLLVKSFTLKYKWKTSGPCNLIMLAHTLHLRLLSRHDEKLNVLSYFKYNSIDGELVGVVFRDSWYLKLGPISVGWYSKKGIEAGNSEIISTLRTDVESLDSNRALPTSSYFYGKSIARAARFALIAEEIGVLDVIPNVAKFLNDTISPWLDGTFQGNGFLYEKKWRGIVTELGSNDPGADFGFGIYNDHHYHLGYFIYGIAVLAKLDPAWGKQYKAQALSLVADFMNTGRQWKPYYPRVRCFDFFMLHSWAAGLTEFTDGRNQESTSEAVNGYYSVALLGLAYSNNALVSVGSMLMQLETLAAQTWWHVGEDSKMYGDEFTKENRLVGVLWSKKRDSSLWFGGVDNARKRDYRLGIQLLPITPVSEVLFSNVDFVKQLVSWTLMSYSSEEGWMGFIYALEGMYNKQDALNKVMTLTNYDDGNSLTNLLWWLLSR